MDFETLTAVVVGGLISLATSVAYHAWDRYRRRISLQRMIRAEIQSIFSGVERRRHEEKIQEVVRQYRQGEISEPYYQIFGLDNRHTLEVYKTNIEYIGLLPKDNAEKVVHFYKGLEGVIDDVVEIGNGGGGSAENRADTLEEDIEIWHELKKLGPELRKEL
jgi:hypothetical protein